MSELSRPEWLIKISEKFFDEILDQSMASVNIEIAMAGQDAAVTAQEMEAAKAGAAAGIVMTLQRLQTEDLFDADELTHYFIQRAKREGLLP